MNPGPPESLVHSHTELDAVKFLSGNQDELTSNFNKFFWNDVKELHFVLYKQGCDAN